MRFEVADRNYYIEGVEDVVGVSEENDAETSETEDKPENIKPSAVFIGHDIARQTLRKKLFRQTKPEPETNAGRLDKIKPINLR